MPKCRPLAVLGLLLVVSLAGPLARAQTVSCTGVPTWVATTTYNPGDRVVHNGKLYQAVVQGANIPPDYCPSCGWWTLLGTCGTGGGDTTPPTASITSPAGGATVSGTVTVNASAGDNVGVTRVELRVDGTLTG